MCAPTGHCLCGMGGLLTDIYATDLVGTFFGGFVYVPCVMVKALVLTVLPSPYVHYKHLNSALTECFIFYAT